MQKFFEALANVFKVSELRNRVLFTLGLLAVYRLGASVPIPGVDAIRFEEFVNRSAGSLFGFLDMFSGGQFRRLTVFALGIMPYITASIVLQLLTVVIPTLEKLQKEGELGRRKITQWTRYLTIGLSMMQSMFIATALQKQGNFVLNPGIAFVLQTMLTLTAGTAFIMWLGEQITERGIGNGMSLIIFAGIVAGLPAGIAQIYRNTFVTGQWHPLQMIIILAAMVLVVAFIVLVERGERRIPVQYAKRVVGRRMLGGQSTHMPLKVNAGGVIPVIFASSLLAFPLTLLNVPALANNPLDLQHITVDGIRRTAVCPAVRRTDRLLLIFLRVNHLQSERGGRQHAPLWRVHPGHPSGQEHRRLHERHSQPHHCGGRAVSFLAGHHSADHDQRHQAAAPAARDAGQLD